MRILLALLLLAVSLPSAAAAEPSLRGRWLFYKKVYGGVEMPEGPGATLRMEFEFLPSGESRLSWRHEGENDHCARQGRYEVQGDHLVEEVVWVDPANTYGCSSDPDMQLGRRTRTPFHFVGPDLAIRFFLGDQPLDMIWAKQSKEAE